MKKWQLSEIDYYTAKKYLEKKMKIDVHNYIPNIDAQLKAQEDFEKVKDVTMLQDFINTHLLKDQIKKLRTFLRVEKSRQSKYNQNITISSEVRMRLADFAKCNNVTLSEAIDLLLKKQNEP